MNFSSPSPHSAELKFFQDPPASEMVILPRGQFVMGKGDEVQQSIERRMDMVRVETRDEHPAHLVQIGYDLAMARYCVSFAEYDLYARANGLKFPEDEGWGRGNSPVVNVTWRDARGYAKWLAKVTGNLYRLPSEAEWEYAARAGTTTDYWWGDTPDTANANYIETPGGGPFSVNSLEPNPWGLYNMHGNVSEWVEDCFHENYFGAPVDGSAWTSDYTWTDPAQDWVRVLRGGDYLSDANEIRSSYRSRADSFYSGRQIGFRVALDLANL